MIYFSILFTFLLSFFAFIRHRTLFNPNVTFCLLFTLSLSLASLNYNKVPQPSSFSIFIVLLGVLSFWTGCSIADLKKRSKYNVPVVGVSIRRLNIVLILGVISTFIEIKRNVSVFLQGGLMEIYAQRLAMEYSGAENELSKNYLEAINRQFVFSPLMYFLMPMSLYMYFIKNKKSYLYISFAILFSILISDGGRTVVMLYVIYLIFFIQYKKRWSHRRIMPLKKDFKLKYKILSFLIAVFTAYVFISRATDFEDTIVSYYGYPILFMEKKLEIALQSGYTFGMMALQGLIRPILNIIKMGTGMTFELLERASDASSIVQQAEYLSSEVMYNAFVTPFYYFYIDFNLLGVVVESLLFGYFTEKSYLKFRYGDSDRATVLYALAFAFPICFAQVRFAYALNLMPWAIILALFVCSKREKMTIHGTTH